MAWALWKKRERTEKVEMIETFVQQLHNLVPPPRTGNDPGPASKPDVRSINVLTKGKACIAPWQVVSN
jgi:hypothetical protein